MKKTSVLTLLLLSSLYAQAQNVGIGTATPSASAKLEIVDASRGILLPRVSLTATNVSAPVTSPANWLVVFNTATAGAGATAVSPGMYYWDGTQWVRVQSGNTVNDWQLLGNAGTNPTTNFIGTTDVRDFVTRTSNAERMRITSGGNVGIGTNNPTSLLHVMGNGFFEGTLSSVTASTDGAIEIFRNNPGGTPTSFGYIDFKDNMADDYDMRVELRSYAGNNHLILANNTASPSVAVSQTTGNVGINLANPDASAQLEVAAANRGVLIPRVALTANNVAGPVTTPATSLLVYNTATVAGANAVSPGFYYWNGTMWLRITDAAEDGWKLGGNALAGPRTFGSTNAQAVQFMSNNIVRGQINPADGEFVWGATASPYLGDALCAVATATTTFALNGYSAQNGSGTWGEILTGSATGFSAVQGVYGGSGTGAGVLGNYNGTNTTNTRAGVVGICSTPTAAGGAGVRGQNSITTGNMRMGVLGQYATTAFGIGVHGIGAGGGIITGNNDVAVVGWRADNANYSGYFNGNHAVANGTKSASVPTTKGNQLLYCMESPEVWFEDFGTAQLQNGEAEVKLDEMYLETVLIDDEHPMHVFVQVQGECNDVYVIPNKTGFTVKEKQGGRSNVKFSYRLVAKRLHFPDHRFGNDPVWGPGDTRQYSKRAPKRPIDYNEQVKQDLEAKRNWKPTPSPAVTYPDETQQSLTREPAQKLER